MLSLGIHFAPGALEKQMNSWPKGREAKGDCVDVEGSVTELSLGLKANKRVSGTAWK